MMVGRPLSYWEGNFSVAILVSGSVTLNTSKPQEVLLFAWMSKHLPSTKLTCKQSPIFGFEGDTSLLVFCF